MIAPILFSLSESWKSAGLILRNRSTEDRRAYALTPTEEGKKLNAKAAAAVEAYDFAITKGLSEQERSLLIDLLHKIERNAKQYEVSDD